MDDRFIGAPYQWGSAHRTEDAYPSGSGSSRLNYEYVLWIEKKLIEALDVLDRLKTNGVINGYHIEGIK